MIIHLLRIYLEVHAAPSMIIIVRKRESHNRKALCFDLSMPTMSLAQKGHLVYNNEQARLEEQPF